MKRAPSKSSLKKLSDKDINTCISLTSSELVSIRLTVNVHYWPIDNATFHIILHHTDVTLFPSDWHFVYTNTMRPNPTPSINFRRVCRVVQSTSAVTDTECFCISPCYMFIEITFLNQTQINLCEILVSLLPA